MLTTCKTRGAGRGCFVIAALSLGIGDVGLINKLVQIVVDLGLFVEQELPFRSVFLIPKVHLVSAATVGSDRIRDAFLDLRVVITCVVAIEGVVGDLGAALDVVVRSRVVVEARVAVDVLGYVVHLAIPLEEADRRLAHVDGDVRCEDARVAPASELRVRIVKDEFHHVFDLLASVRADLGPDSVCEKAG